MATLSGLLPERANDTSSVGTSACSRSCGPRHEIGRRDRIDAARQAATPAPAARQSPMKADVPAPVSTMRSAGSASSGARNLVELRAFGR